MRLPYFAWFTVILIALCDKCRGEASPIEGGEEPEMIIDPGPIYLLQDEHDELVDLPICPVNDAWSFGFHCFNPKEEIKCHVAEEKPVCKCDKKYTCSAKATHDVETSGQVPCTFICKSPEAILEERNDQHKYDMGLLLRGKKK